MNVISVKKHDCNDVKNWRIQKWAIKDDLQVSCCIWNGHRFQEGLKKFDRKSVSKRMIVGTRTRYYGRGMYSNFYERLYQDTKCTYVEDNVGQVRLMTSMEKKILNQSLFKDEQFVSLFVLQSIVKVLKIKDYDPTAWLELYKGVWWVDEKYIKSVKYAYSKCKPSN